MRRLLPISLLTGALALGAVTAAQATHPQPPLDYNKVDYSPIGHFKPGDPIPSNYETACDEVAKPLLKGEIFNPSGKWNGFDTEVFQVLCLPFRNQDDTSDQDPTGNGGGETRHGYCNGANPADPTDPGTCPNHQLEYIRHFHATMKEILGEFGGYATTYEFEHPEGVGRNPSYVVPGSDHPDEHILIGSHYDQTTSGPASAWDSQEGHATMIRIAKIMADYWRTTGTRPSATVKFVPMDGEEDGLLGSADYVANTIVPDQEAKVRSYWNADPCAGGYPAFHYGGPNRVDLGIQIGDSDDPRVQAFNEKVPGFVEAVFDRLDDNLETHPAKPELFVSSSERPGAGDIGTEVFIGTDTPVIFSSDWRNFIAVNIPFFNPGPEVTGPNAPGSEGPGGNTAGTPEGIYQFHTPIDNLETMSRYTGAIPPMTWPEGWIKGMEFCANMLASGMLQPDAGGTQVVDTSPVAHFEALPNEGETGKFVNFNGSGSYQYSDPASRTKRPNDELQWRWDFGDGVVAYGPQVKHVYRATGVYTAKLTLRNRTTNASDEMTLPITIIDGTGADVDPPGQFVDNVPSQGSVVACSSAAGFRTARVRAAGKRLKISVASDSPNPMLVELFQVAKGSRAQKAKRVATFRNVKKSFTFKGSRKVKRGSYFLRLSVKRSDNSIDARAIGLDYTTKFKVRKAFQRPDSCALVSSFRLSTPAFGGRQSLRASVSVTSSAKLSVRLVKGRKTVKRFSRNAVANRAQVFVFPARKLRRGEYKVVVQAVASNGAKRTETLYTRKL